MTSSYCAQVVEDIMVRVSRKKPVRYYISYRFSENYYAEEPMGTLGIYQNIAVKFKE